MDDQNPAPPPAPYSPPPPPGSPAPVNDVNTGVLATGCGWGCGLGCLQLALLTALAVAAGVQTARNSGGLGFIMCVGLVGSVATDVAVGYFTAKAAREKGVAPNAHVIILGIIFMVMGLYGFIDPQKAKLPEDTRSLSMLLTLVSWIATIPLMLWGASLAENEEQ